MSKGFLNGVVGGVVGAALTFGGVYAYNNFLQTPANNAPTQTQTTSQDGGAQVSTVNIDVNDGVTQAVAKVKGAVVSVINLQSPASSTPDNVWGNLFGEGTSENEEDKDNSQLQAASEGSGVIYKKEGGKAFIVTNNHVVAGQDGLEIQLSNGDRVKGTLVGADSYSDLAVITIPDKHVETVATFADSDKLQVGEPAIAIGSPLGTDFANTVTSGIVSALSRSVVNRNDQNQLVSINAVQTDAAINPGNSGGALINIAGQVIGINSSKIAASASGTGVEGMGFAIPSNDVVTIIRKLEQDGRVVRPGIGITSLPLSALNSQQLHSLNLPDDVTGGVIVMSTTPDWPAAVAGLKERDVITQIAGDDVEDANTLQSILFRHSVGDTVEVVFYRDGKQETVQMKLDKDFTDLPQQSGNQRGNQNDDDNSNW